MDVELFTRDGGFVAKETIPPFTEPPDLLIWGLRFFLRREEGKYYESFTWAIVPRHPEMEQMTHELPFTKPT